MDPVGLPLSVKSDTIHLTSTGKTMSQSRPIAMAVLTLLVFIWGSTWLVIKIGLETLPPFWFAGLRFTLATGVLYLFARWRGLRFPREWQVWKVMITLGLCELISYAAVFWGEQFIGSALAAVLFSTMPFIVIVLNYFFLKEFAIRVHQVIGIAISFIGVVLIFREDIYRNRLARAE